MNERHARSWADIIQHYRSYVGAPALQLAGMLGFVEQVAASRYASGLHGTTSMHMLLVAQASVFEFQRQMLQIEPVRGRLVFTYYEEPFLPPRWTRTCEARDGFATLEHFLLNVKRWWVEQPPPSSHEG